MTQVSSNGLISFDRDLNAFSPVLFPNSTSYSYIVAPFWADHDTRLAGQVSYRMYNKSDNIIPVVSRFIRQQTETDFDGSWMLVAHWKDIPEHRSDGAKVSSVIIRWQTFSIKAAISMVAIY